MQGRANMSFWDVLLGRSAERKTKAEKAFEVALEKARRDNKALEDTVAGIERSGFEQALADIRKPSES